MTKKIYFTKRLHISKIFRTFAPKFPERGFKTSLGPPKILIFGESGGTSRPVDLTEWYQHYDLVAERDHKYQRLMTLLYDESNSDISTFYLRADVRE